MVGFWFQCWEECMRNVQTAFQISVSEFRPNAALLNLSTPRQNVTFPMLTPTCVTNTVPAQLLPSAAQL
jgi:hypothetical protein